MCVSEEDTANTLEEFMDANDAPSPNDAQVHPWPSAQLHAIDRVRDAELANVLNKTEILIVRFYQKGHLTLRLGQVMFGMLRHPEFDITEIRSDSIVQLIRRLERPFAETAVQTYNLWKEGDGDQRLELVVRDWLETWREIMRNPEWKKHFDLAFRPMFDEAGGRLIGPACTAFWWGRIQKILGPGAAVGVAQLYFDETFQGKNQGLDTGSLASMNLKQDARFQTVTSSIKMYCLVPTYDADAEIISRRS